MLSPLAIAVNSLTARWAATCSGESTVMSGAAVWPLLACLASAADGRGRAELMDAIGADPSAASAVQGILDGSPAITSALGLWARNDVPVLLPGVLGELTGDPAVDQPRLDAWAAAQTGGAIPAMPIATNEETALVLAAAMTVRTTWLRPFIDDVECVESGPWAGRDLAVLRRCTAILDRVRVAETPAGLVTAVRVMGTGGIDVHLLLGEESSKAAEVLATEPRVLPGVPLGSGPGITVSTVPADSPDDILTLTVPRFSITSAHDLLAHPEVYGLATVSDQRYGHFPGISAEVPLAISQAAQHVTATFQAEGFQSAAVTAFGAVVGGPAPRLPYRAMHVEVDFTRPFGFLTVERRSGLILTAGWIADPSLPHFD